MFGTKLPLSWEKSLYELCFSANDFSPKGVTHKIVGTRRVLMYDFKTWKLLRYRYFAVVVCVAGYKCISVPKGTYEKIKSSDKTYEFAPEDINRIALDWAKLPVYSIKAEHLIAKYRNILLKNTDALQNTKNS